MKGRTDGVWQGVAWGLSVLFLVLLGIAVSGRLAYPFELEWQEGAMVVHVLRVMAGRRLYVPPSLDFTPFIYPPLYFYAAAGLANFVGVGFLPLRLLSLLSTLVLLALVGYGVYRETGAGDAAGVAVALMAASYRLNGTWFDLGRVDAFFLLLTFTAILVLRFAKAGWHEALAAFLFTLAFLTKQTAVFVVALLYVYMFLKGGQRRWAFVGSFPLFMGVSFLFFHVHTHGWFTYYVLRLPSGHALLPYMVKRFWTHDILPHFTLAMVFMLTWLYLCGREHGEALGFWMVVFVGLVGSAWLSRVHEGGYLNVLMPAHLAFALGLGMFSGWLTTRVELSGLRWGGRVFILLQLLLLLYNPLPLRPSPRNVQAGYKLLNVLVHIRGEVLIPYHGYLAEMAGKRSFAHEMAISDVLRGDPGGWGTYLDEEYQKALGEHRFQAIVLDQEDWRYIEVVRQHYEGPTLIFQDKGAFWPITGFRTRPQYLFLEKTQLVRRR